MDDIVKEALEAFAQCEEAEDENRQLALDDLKFARLGEQWPESVKKQREVEGRPCLTINRMPSFIRQVVNDARQNKPSIKVHPVDDTADPETAKILSGLIRNIEYISSADIAYDTAIDFAASMGFGYFRIVMDYAYDDTFDMDLMIKRIANPFTVYGDPSSQEADGCDWNLAFITEMLQKDEYLKKYPGAKISDWDGEKDEKSQRWFDGDSIRTAEYWKRDEVEKKLLLLSNGLAIQEEQYLAQKDLFDLEGLAVVQQRPVKSYKVKQFIMNGEEVIDENDWAGKYIPIVPVYGEEINVEGKKVYQSLIRQAKDAQRMLNYWRTTSTELVALAPRVPFIGPKGAFDGDAQKWATVNSQSHAYIEYDGQIPPQRQPLESGPAAGAMQEALMANDDMKSIMGVHDASLGAKSNETSGRAIMARQQEGDTSTFHFIDNMTRSIRHAGRILVDLIPHVYSKERIVRVMGEDGTPETKQINKPVEIKTEDGEPVTQIYDVRTGKYDIVVTAGPSFNSRRAEAAEQMTQLIRSYPDAAPLIGDILAKNLDWPGADEIAERMKRVAEQRAGMGQEDPEKQQMAQMMQQGQQVISQLQQQVEKLTAEKEQTKFSEDMQSQADKISYEQKILQLNEQLAEANIEKQKLEALAQIRAQMESVQPQPQGTVEPSQQTQQPPINLTIDAGSLRTADEKQAQEAEENAMRMQQTQAVLEGINVIAQQIAALNESVSKPKKVVRDQSGAIVGAVSE